MKTIAIIYHDADFDGKLSNEACRHWLRKLHPDAIIHSYGWDYGRSVPIPFIDAAKTITMGWPLFDAIYIVDLSVDELMALPELRKKIVWIDHHKSAIEKWTPKGVEQLNRGFTGYRLDGVAACRLCWQWWAAYDKYPGILPVKHNFFDRSVSEPELIRLAGEYDVWDHRDPAAKALQFGLRALNDTDLASLVRNQFDGIPTGIKLDDVIAQGYAIKSYCDKNSHEYASQCAHHIAFEGLRFCALNIGQRGNSDLLIGGFTDSDDAGFAWRYTGTHALVSLYHLPGREHHDLSKIAVKYGGGGHKGACGFRLTLQQLADVFGKGQE
jgi:hypothetical protein